MPVKSKYGNKQGTNPKPDNKKRPLTNTENKLLKIGYAFEKETNYRIIPF